MLSILKNKSIYLLTLGLLIWGCSSQEYTSAKLYIQNEDWEKAEEFLLKSLETEQEKESPEVHVQVGYHVYGRKGDWDNMNKMFDKALAFGADKKILQGRPTSEYIEDFRSLYWAQSYNEGVKVFNDYKRSGDKAVLQKAADKFEETKSINPKEGQAYFILASCYADLGDSDRAMDNAKQSVELTPEDFQANLAIGQLLSRQKKTKVAIQYLKKAVELNPSNTFATRLLATAYYDQGNKEESIATFEKAIKGETDKKIKADLYFNLGVLNMQIGDFQNAEDSFLSAYDLNPDDSEALVGMAQTFENVEKWRRAEKFYKELIVLEPDNPDHYKGMARVLIKQGDHDAATRYYEKSKKVGN